jgi:glutathione synthase/RimK-type ligase-like ATP-grasp enzyme
MIGIKMMTKPVLILSQSLDPHTVEVCNHLDSLGQPWALFDPGWFPATSMITGRLGNDRVDWDLMLKSQEQTIVLNEVRSIWNRRPGSYGEHGLTVTEPVEKEFIDRETKAGVGGLLRSVSEVNWVNHPDVNRYANYKPLQLTRARACGFSVPRTLVTSDPDALAPFYEECHGHVIYKLLGKPVYYSNDQRSSFSAKTSIVTAEILKEAHRLHLAPALFQERIPKAFDVRITIIGPHIIATEIHPHSEEARLDFRRDYEHVSYCPHQLPAMMKQQLVQLMKCFSLVYAAIDMIVTPADEYVFIEVNPNGQFGFIEKQTGVPLFKTMACYLAYGE